jgi:hypothetical protein
MIARPDLARLIERGAQQRQSDEERIFAAFGESHRRSVAKGKANAMWSNDRI